MSRLFEKNHFFPNKLFSNIPIKICFYLLLFTYIFSFGYNLTKDSDFGWHLRYGEEIVNQRKISVSDTFTHTVRGTTIINNEWLNDVIYFLLFSHFSFIGLSIFFGLIIALSFFLPLFSIKSALWTKFLIVSWSLLGTLSIIKVGARAQIFSFLGFSILLYSFLEFQKTHNLKKMLFIPILFLFWANIHPGFYLGLSLFPIFIVGESFPFIVNFLKTKHINPFLFRDSLIILLILIISFCLTSFRPQGNTSNLNLNNHDFFAIVKELFLPLPLVSPSGVRVTISEWLPPFLSSFSGTIYFLAIIFSVSLISLKKIKEINLFKLLLLFFLIYFSSLSRRNIPFFMLVFIPFTIENLVNYLSKLNKFNSSFNLLSVIVMLSVVITQVPGKTKKIVNASNGIENYCQEIKCPYGAVKFLKEKKPKGNMFNEYNWGGFLIWQLPEYPVFIDGRMPSGIIFEEYNAVKDFKKNWYEILDKYSVNLMLIYPNEFFEEVLISEKKWEKIYSDEQSVVLIRN